MNVSKRSLLGLLALVAAASLGSQWWAGRAQDSLGTRLAEAAAPGDIRLISSVTCPSCANARAWLTTHRVPYQECFIERDAACMAAFEALPVRATPTVMVRGQVHTGFSAERVLQVLTATAAPGGG